MQTPRVKSAILAALFQIVIFFLPEVIQAKQDIGHKVVAAIVYGKHNVATLNGFKEGMKERGYIEGKNISYMFDGPFTNKNELDSAMESLMARNPDLIFAATTPAAIAAKKATRKNKIPVVFGPVNDPVRSEIVKEQKYPGDNITGVMLTDSIAKQLEWAVRIVPGIKTILLPYNPDDKSSLISMQKIHEAVKLFKLDLVVRETYNDNNIDELLVKFPKGIDLIFLPRDGMIMGRVEDFARVAREKKLVLTGTRYEMAEHGALLGFGFKGFELGRQMSRLADLILNGSKPARLPVETAEDYLSINLQTAREIGITIDEHVLRQAHVIIR